MTRIFKNYFRSHESEYMFLTNLLNNHIISKSFKEGEYANIFFFKKTLPLANLNLEISIKKIKLTKRWFVTDLTDLPEYYVFSETFSNIIPFWSWMFNRHIQYYLMANNSFWKVWWQIWYFDIFLWQICPFNFLLTFHPMQCVSSVHHVYVIKQIMLEFFII